jgi:hypothetical protein
MIWKNVKRKCRGIFQIRNVFTIVMGKPEVKRSHSTPRRTWKDNIKMDRIVRETWLYDVDWIHLAQDRDRWRTLLNTVVNFRVS